MQGMLFMLILTMFWPHQNLAIGDVESFMLRHEITEACTAIKAAGFLELMRREAADDHFVYLDPDIWVFSKFEELEKALLTNEIVLTPHHLNEEFAYNEVVYSVFATMMCGIYNLGFIALSRSQTVLFFELLEHFSTAFLLYRVSSWSVRRSAVD